jgi:uncharacterized membrane protein
MTTLVVLKFPTARGAARKLNRLQKFQEQRLIQIEDGAILTWPLGTRKPKTKRLTYLSGGGALSGEFWGLLVGLLFAVPIFGTVAGTAIGTLADNFASYGIDSRFIKQVRDTITEDTSALFLLTSGAVLDKVVAAVKGAPFEIMSTNLSQEQEDQLLETFGKEILVW